MSIPCLFTPSSNPSRFFFNLNQSLSPNTNLCSQTHLSKSQFYNNIMHNFGDELTIESYRVPWLIWIQVIVMVLLLLLLYCFSILVVDLSEDNTKPSSSNSRFVSNHNITTTVSSNRLHNSQVRESIKGEIVPSTSRVMRAEDMVEMEGSAMPNIYLHPCHYFRLARLAFLKCLGLDPTGENSSSPQRGNRKES